MIANAFHHPYIISWNLTYRCNLACEHCYLDAGAPGFRKDSSPAFFDRSELTTEQCFRVIDQIHEFAPEAITILTGGEPLLRKDILEIIRYGSQHKLWIVVGTNGVLITENLAFLLKETGVRGLALSLDALDPETHDQFRLVKGAWDNTVRGAQILNQVDLPFIVQTTVGRHNKTKIDQIADFAYQEMKAKVFNLYFLVPTGRGQFISDMTPTEYNDVLKTLSAIQNKYEGKMIVNAKCAPHYVRHLFENEPESPFLKTYSGGAGGCPAGTHYMGIRPNGDMTPCPYLPLFGGNLKKERMVDIWNNSELFGKIRARNHLGERCGACEFNEKCGGCRARAYGMSSDFMQEDPLCDYTPGKFHKEAVTFQMGSTYGLSYHEIPNTSIQWDEEALKKMQQIPAFVRGMVKSKMEAYCQKKGLTRVTLKELSEMRSKMPASKIFARQS